MTNFDETTYTISETAEKLNLSEKTLRRWEEAGRFTPSRTLGNQRRYTTEDLQILDAIKHNVIPHQKDLLSQSAAATFLGVTEPTVERLVTEGTLYPFVTVAGRYYPRHRLLPLLTELKATPPQPLPSRLPPTPAAPTPPLTPPTQPLASPPLPPVAKYPMPPTTYIVQALITLALLTAYHLLFRPAQLPTSPTPESGAVQGAATNPSLRLLDDMLDPTTGGLTASTITSKLGTITPNLTLLPGVAPLSPLPGSLYYDGGDNTLKVYTTYGWQTLTTSEALKSLQFDLENKVATMSQE